MSGGHTPYPAKCTRAFRDALVALFPALQIHPRAVTYRRIVEYILYSSMRESDTGRLVVPAAALARLDKANQSNKDEQTGRCWSALALLEDFSRDVWPLDIRAHVPGERARTIDPGLPESLMALPDFAAVLLGRDDLVWLVSGLPVTPTSRRKSAHRYMENISALADGVPEDHPAGALQQYLNAQPSNALSKTIRSNWQSLMQALEAMPEGKLTEANAKRAAAYTLSVLADHTRHVYRGSDSTVRLFTLGVTIHNLPRDLRKIALSGSVEMDIRSSQLTIVAKIWGLPKVTAFLESKASIWTELLSFLDIDPRAKGLLKDALYATCFGMGRKNLIELLANGNKKYNGIGLDKAKQFLRNDLIRELLCGRRRYQKRIAEAGGVCDAFSRWHETPDHALHALAAIEAQSWELRLMLCIFEAVKGDPDVSILSWLHDGVVVSLRDKRRTNSVASSLKNVFDRHAQALGFSTELEIDLL